MAGLLMSDLRMVSEQVSSTIYKKIVDGQQDEMLTPQKLVEKLPDNISVYAIYQRVKRDPNFPVHRRGRKMYFFYSEVMNYYKQTNR